MQKPKIKVAYFSLEIMLETEVPTYAGGLGVLASDLLRSCADMRVPAVGVSLVYNGTYFNQIFRADGSQSFAEVDWRKNDHLIELPEKVTVKIDGQEVLVGCWRYDIVGYSGFIVPVYLLDTDYSKNAEWMRDITQNLYGGKYYARICQEIILGIGGVKMLQEIGYTDIENYHMNEGHAAFVPLALMPELSYQDIEVKKKCVFTTHTPVPEGHDVFGYDFAYKYAGEYLPWHIKKIATQEKLHMTYLALNLSKYSFGVSQKHSLVAKHMFPGYNIDYITNGVHHRNWIGPIMQELYNTYLPGWIEYPSILKKAPEKIADDVLWQAHRESKKLLIDFVNKHITSGTTEEEIQHPKPEDLFDVDTLTISLARRPVPYKRPLLLYQDLLQFVRVAAGKIQVIHSGKAHPDNEISEHFVREILRISKKLKGIIRIVYLENYSPTVARLLVAGTDIWLNTPIRPLEASGTSGMKAAMNGVLNFSVLDGWWIEGYQMCPDAGFPIGSLSNDLTPQNNDDADARDVYTRLQNDIIPLYYTKRPEWIRRMKQAITLGSYFNTNRCVQEYVEKAWK